MEIYLVIFGISLALTASSMIDQSGRRIRPYPFLFALSAIVLILLLSLREGVGTDYFSIYVDGFNSAAQGMPSRFEVGYNLLQSFIAIFTNDYHVLFFVAALITVGLTYLAIYRLSADPVLSIVIFLFGGFFFFSTNAIRQCIAEAIFLNALFYLIQKRPGPFLILALIASTFHTAALCYLPLYFFTKRQISPKAMFVIAVSLFVIGGIAFNALFHLASMVSPQFAQYIKLDQYFTGDFDVIDFVYLFLSLLLWAFMRYRMGNDRQINNKQLYLPNIYASILFIGLLFTILSLNAAIMFRMARMFTPILILAIPNFLQSLSGEEERFPIKIFIILFFVTSCIFIYGYMNFDTVVPYESFFF